MKARKPYVSAWHGEGTPCALFHRPGTIDGNTLQAVILNDEYRFKEQALTAGSVVLDLGAYIGAFSVLAASMGHRVIAVEPVPENVDLFEMNTARWADRIELHQAALWGSSGTVQLASGDDQYLHMGYTAAEVPPWLLVRGAVATVTLDEILGPLDRVAFAKMDIEGAEFHALEGADPANLEKIDIIAAEVHPTEGQTLPQALERFEALLPHLTVTRAANGSVVWLRRRSA